MSWLWLTLIWLVFLSSLIALIFLITERIRRAPAKECRGCGYNLTGNESGFCPECGMRILGAPVGWKFYKLSTDLPWRLRGEIHGTARCRPAEHDLRPSLLAFGGLVLILLGAALLGLGRSLRPRSQLLTLLTGLGAPLTWCTGLMLIVAAIILMIVGHSSSPSRLPRCRKCGYNLTGNVSGVCPECGERI